MENLKKKNLQAGGRKNACSPTFGVGSRYYWKYGNYVPDERMGGKEGFRKLCDGAKELGVHVMPMFGINVVGSHFENYEDGGFLPNSEGREAANTEAVWIGTAPAIMIIIPTVI